MDWVIGILLLKIFIASLSSSLSSFLPSYLPPFLLLFLPSFRHPQWLSFSVGLPQLNLRNLLWIMVCRWFYRFSRYFFNSSLSIVVNFAKWNFISSMFSNLFVCTMDFSSILVFVSSLLLSFVDYFSLVISYYVLGLLFTLLPTPVFKNSVDQ